MADEKGLEKVFQKLVEAGTKDVYAEHLNLSGHIRGRLMDEMKGADKNIVAKFYSSQSKEYREDLEKLVKKLVGKYHMNLLLDLVIFHREFQGLKKN